MTKPAWSAPMANVRFRGSRPSRESDNNSSSRSSCPSLSHKISVGPAEMIAESRFISRSTASGGLIRKSNS